MRAKHDVDDSKTSEAMYEVVCKAFASCEEDFRRYRMPAVVDSGNNLITTRHPDEECVKSSSGLDTVLPTMNMVSAVWFHSVIVLKIQFSGGKSSNESAEAEYVAVCNCR